LPEDCIGVPLLSASVSIRLKSVLGLLHILQKPKNHNKTKNNKWQNISKGIVLLFISYFKNCQHEEGSVSEKEGYLHGFF
jgi:hypothetical protein